MMGTGTLPEHLDTTPARERKIGHGGARVGVNSPQIYPTLGGGLGLTEMQPQTGRRSNQGDPLRSRIGRSETASVLKRVVSSPDRTSHNQPSCSALPLAEQCFENVGSAFGTQMTDGSVSEHPHPLG